MDTVSVVRLSVFISVFCIMAVLEACIPARKSILSRKERWVGNLSMVIFGAVLSRLIIPASLVGISFWASERGYGLLNMLSVGESDLVSTVAVTVGVLILDIVIYWQHRLFHTVPLLWRVHKMHHADSHVDTTTGLRFHPIEIVISLGIKAAAVVAFGLPVLAIIIFEVALNGFALFNHANIRLPQQWDDRLSKFIITQRLHRIHHSQVKEESNSNFGFSVSWWDKVFNSFKARAHESDESLPIGQRDVPATKGNATLLSLLRQPFFSSTDDVSAIRK
ncbi:sterol desaturase family protein [Alteromonas sp. BMJM2]|uniref:sterol desaturase family protein n=1 Tax=Alteromonas sp. BMJM2 TaxID=2954241 RepID=UPI0022B41349|nr:sterol desaturase family protein [Alteromonas sp. BMJM2]